MRSSEQVSTPARVAVAGIVAGSGTRIEFHLPGFGDAATVRSMRVSCRRAEPAALYVRLAL
jgi:hypothetical protein